MSDRLTPDEIRAARAELGLTQPQLGDALGVPVDTLKSWEAPEGSARHRRMDPTASRVVRWMLAPGRPPEWPPR